MNGERKTGGSDKGQGSRQNQKTDQRHIESAGMYWSIGLVYACMKQGVHTLHSM